MCHICEPYDRSDSYGDDSQLSALKRAYAEKQAAEALRLMDELDALSGITYGEGGHV